ncbi:MAG TPA: FAD-linked oxidase C-terminal domain-containing protein [Acidimicrobiales bacterium]|nr:FAD-linked oxidase C-terminal domain-containing protein [Acidimicrobiales bacterium]
MAGHFVDRLIAAVGRDAVLAGEAIGPDYCVDETLKALPVRPAAVVFPSATAEVAAVIEIACELGVAVTARGAGTGLSGACIPLLGGLVVSFERMSAVLEIDDAGHVAIVQPGLTLAELDRETAKHGLVYPVFPGTNAASLGGNVATNAGGMRAVKYGVTRHQVLGIEAVTGTGEVIRTGGRFVKNTSGYDLTQLIIGSEGTLALVTEATLRLHPRLHYSASILAPFATIDSVAEVIPQVVASGVQPMILEYIDRSTMRGLLRMNDLALGIPAAVEAATEAYLVVVLEGRTEDRLEHDVGDVATQLSRAGAYDVYVLPPGQGADLLAARESAFWMVKAAGADDVIDMVVPRNRIPAYLRRVQQLTSEQGSRVFGCGHAGDGNIHFSVYEPDADRRSKLLSAIFEMGMAMGGAISGEHGIGRTKKRYYQALEDPAKLALQRRIKAAFDPHGILNPGCIFD